MITIEFLQLVDQLEDLLKESWRIPFTSTLLVNEEECLRIIDQLRVSVPEELGQARRLLLEKKRIIAEAEREAKQIVASAHAQVANMAKGREAVRPIRERSRAIIAEAERQAEALKRDADEYARQTLEALQEQLEALLTQVRKGIAYLERERHIQRPRRLDEGER